MRITPHYDTPDELQHSPQKFRFNRYNDDIHENLR